MRLVVLDTNVIVSAGIEPRGAPAKIVMGWVSEGHVQVVTSREVVAEYRDVVRRLNFQRYGFPPPWLEFLIEESLRLVDSEPWGLACPDPSDLPFLALASAAGAWLVTGNLSHFPESSRGGVKVLSPAEYLVHLEGSETRL